MALWHFLDETGVGFSWKENGVEISAFDDGLQFLLGEPGFSTDAAKAKAESLGAGIVAEYTGTPNYSERIEREAREAQDAADAKAAQEHADARAAQAQAEADAKTAQEQADADARAAQEAAARQQADAAIDALLHPRTPEDLQRDQINAYFDGLLSAAPDRSADIEKLRGDALAELLDL